MAENSKQDDSMYAKLGVDAGKQNVRTTFGPIVENKYPCAFVNIIDHPTQKGVVCTLHMDGDGSKFIQRLLMYLELGDPCVFWGAIVDAMEMNFGDIAAAGFVDFVIVADTININGFNVPKEVILQQLAGSFADVLDLYRQFDLDVHFLGGETADLPDQIKSIVFDIAVYAETKKENIIKGNVMPGDVIYGFASDGQAVWEKEYNSGLMSNGSTLGRYTEMHPRYGIKYPFLIRDGASFKGKAEVGDDVSKALISPTRHWSIVIKKIIQRLKEEDLFDKLHAISMNTGGGATKISHVGQGIVYNKYMPASVPSIFQEIQRHSGESWRNMYQTFNCGIGIDVVGKDDANFIKVLRAVENELQIKCQQLGTCAINDSSTENKVILNTAYGRFDDY